MLKGEPSNKTVMLTYSSALKMDSSCETTVNPTKLRGVTTQTNLHFNPQMQ
jgi:hypothetical protein